MASSRIRDAANQAELQVLLHQAARDRALKETTTEATSVSNTESSTSTAISTMAKRKQPGASVEDAIDDDDVEIIENPPLAARLIHD